MSINLDSIDSTLLSTITGAGTSKTEAELKLDLDLKKGTGGGRIGGSQTTTDYAQCLKTMSKLPDATAESVSKACGLPPA